MVEAPRRACRDSCPQGPEARPPPRRMNPVFADPADHRVRDHVAARAGPRRDQSRPGLSRRSGPRGRARARRAEAAARRLEPVSADDGPAGTARARSRRITRRFQGLDLDPETEMMVTSGATEALAGALLALIEPGDEVVLFQPMYDAYLPLVRRAGGVPRIRDPAAAALAPRRGRPGGGLLGPRPAWWCSTIRSTRAPRCSRADELELLARYCMRATTRSPSATRSGSTWSSTAPARAADGAARHARAHRQDRLGGQDLLADRLEGRLRLAAARADAR